MLFDGLNYTMNSFMKSQSEVDKRFLDNLFEKPSEQDQIIIQIHGKSELCCIYLFYLFTIIYTASSQKYEFYLFFYKN